VVVCLAEGGERNSRRPKSAQSMQHVDHDTTRRLCSSFFLPSKAQNQGPEMPDAQLAPGPLGELFIPIQSPEHPDRFLCSRCCISDGALFFSRAGLEFSVPQRTGCRLSPGGHVRCLDIWHQGASARRPVSPSRNKGSDVRVVTPRTLVSRDQQKRGRSGRQTGIDAACVVCARDELDSNTRSPTPSFLSFRLVPALSFKHHGA